MVGRMSLQEGTGVVDQRQLLALDAQQVIKRKSIAGRDRQQSPAQRMALPEGGDIALPVHLRRRRRQPVFDVIQQLEQTTRQLGVHEASSGYPCFAVDLIHRRGILWRTSTPRPESQ